MNDDKLVSDIPAKLRKELLDDFAKFDVNGDGSISLPDLQIIFGKHLSKLEFKDRWENNFKGMDQNSDLRISKKEFMEYWGRFF